MSRSTLIIVTIIRLYYNCGKAVKSGYVFFPSQKTQVCNQLRMPHSTFQYGGTSYLLANALWLAILLQFSKVYFAQL